MRSRHRARENAGIARILEAVIAATIIFIAFAAASFFVSNPRTSAVQDRADLDRLGYNVLSRITESGTVQATVGQTPPALEADIQLKTFVQNALPSSILFKLTINQYKQDATGKWVVADQLASVSNTDAPSFSDSIAVSSTPMIYTAPETGSIYYLVLVLANPGGGNS
jgi:hypothetical protein